ncbi:hypothetical protein BDZ91DRAFT_222147 [Kalaharituber pfeilii]|nr:hypothetical protein BDZ91DRAFT_222147 [Kalaharituber pfeilii]
MYFRRRKKLQATGEVEAPVADPSALIPDVVTGVPPPPPPVTPRLNIVMQVIGSRGDVQPFLSLAIVLARPPYNHRVRVATHACFEKFVIEVANRHGLEPEQGQDTRGSIEFFPLAGDPAVLMSFMVRNPGLIPSTSGDEIRQRRKDVWDILVSTWASCYQTSPTSPTARPFVADVVVANPPGFGHLHCAERLGAPVHIMFTMPWAPPTSAFPHPLANTPTDVNGKTKKGYVIDSATINYLTYPLLDILTWQGVGDLVNRFRTEILRLDPLNNVHAPTLLGRLATEGVVPHTYCWSPALIPKPKDWTGESISVSGFWFLDLNTGFTPAAELIDFIERRSEKPLIYIGFGSIVAPDPGRLTGVVLEAIKLANVRALVSRGWGTISPPEGWSDEDVFFLGNTPHDWLFPRVALAVHHGGAGTTAAAIKAGIPSVIVPFFGDQMFWGEMVARRGAGGVCHNSQLTAAKLAELITTALGEDVRACAQELGRIVAGEKGEEVAAVGLVRGVATKIGVCEVEEKMHFIRREEQPKLAVFTVVPQHPVPPGDELKKRRLKTKNKKGIRVSARVAYVLHELGLIDLDDPKAVRLTRWVEYHDHIRRYTETDPATGGASALLGTIVAMGMAGGVDFDRNLFFGVGERNEEEKERSRGAVVEAGEKEVSNVELADVPSEGGEAAAEQGKKTSLSDIASQNHTLASARSAVKPISTIISAGLKSPIDFSLSLSRGFHNLPTMFHDDTVRPLPPVHSSIKGIGSGVSVATKQLVEGIYDGVTGLYSQPVKGMKEEGVAGLVKGWKECGRRWRESI